MSSRFSNGEYLYAHLPARVRRDDLSLFVKRFSQFFGATMDGWDAIGDNFYQSIDPSTASEEFINWWLWALFGWSWYPSWFTLARKRALYAAFATHLAKRGTPVGTEEWLAAFSIYAREFARPTYWGEFVWGEPVGEGAWTITDALVIVVQIYQVNDEVNSDVRGMSWGEMVWGEGYFRDVGQTLTQPEIESLVRYVWPNGHRLMIEYVVFPTVSVEAWDSAKPILNESQVPDEIGGTITGAS